MTLLRRVTYQNTRPAPDPTPRVITFVVNDGTGNSDTATSTVTIVAVNDAPTADDDAYGVAEGGTLNVPAPGVLTATSIAEGGARPAVLVTGPANASSFTLNANGSFTYTHNGSETTTDASPIGPTTAGFNPTRRHGDDHDHRRQRSAGGGGRCRDDHEDTVLSAPAPGVLTNDTDPDAGDTRTVNARERIAGNVGIAITTAKGGDAHAQRQRLVHLRSPPRPCSSALGTGQTDTDSSPTRCRTRPALPSNAATVTITIDRRQRRAGPGPRAPARRASPRTDRRWRSRRR